jgi:hypothetical protein
MVQYLRLGTATIALRNLAQDLFEQCHQVTAAVITARCDAAQASTRVASIIDTVEPALEARLDLGVALIRITPTQAGALELDPHRHHVERLAQLFGWRRPARLDDVIGL